MAAREEEGASLSAGEGGVEGRVEKDDKECTCGNDSGALFPAFLNKFNNEYLELSL